MGTAASKRNNNNSSVRHLVDSGAAQALQDAVASSKAARRALQECGVSKCGAQFDQLHAAHGNVLDRRKQLQEEAGQYIQRVSGLMKEIADAGGNRRQYARLTTDMLGMEVRMQVLKQQQAALAGQLARVVDSPEEDAYLRCLVQEGTCMREALDALRSERDLLRVGRVYDRATERLRNEPPRNESKYYNSRLNRDDLNSDTLVDMLKHRMKQR